jgi:hypothetical protein
MSKKNRDYTPNEKKANVLNPTAKDYKSDQLNTAHQLSGHAKGMKEHVETKPPAKKD